jgi:phosphoribosylanthranilate isomerase
MLVKICGIKSIEEAEMVEMAGEAGKAEGADFIGVVVKSNSRRSVSLERAAEIIGCFDNVILVSNSTALIDYQEIASLEPAGLQIHTEAEIDVDFDGLIIKAVTVPASSTNPERDAKAILRFAERFDVDYYLLDSGCGTGIMHDLRVSRIVAANLPVILAGGLTPENVKEAVSFVKPVGVDVSSGVEENGVKSVERIRKFLNALRS